MPVSLTQPETQLRTKTYGGGMTTGDVIGVGSGMGMGITTSCIPGSGAYPPAGDNARPPMSGEREPMRGDLGRPGSDPPPTTDPRRVCGPPPTAEPTMEPTAEPATDWGRGTRAARVEEDVDMRLGLGAPRGVVG